MNNTCIYCSAIVPEGKQICPSCEYALKNYTVLGAKTKTIKKYVGEQENEQKI